MEITWSSRWIAVLQRKYTLGLLQEVGMLGYKPEYILIKLNNKFGLLENSKTVDKECYQRVVGKLIYLSHTRLDITFVVSQFMHSPHEEHMEAVCKILRCLKRTPEKGLLFEKSEYLKIEAYINAN